MRIHMHRSSQGKLIFVENNTLLFMCCKQYCKIRNKSFFDLMYIEPASLHISKSRDPRLREMVRLETRAHGSGTREQYKLAKGF